MLGVDIFAAREYSKPLGKWQDGFRCSCRTHVAIQRPFYFERGVAQSSCFLPTWMHAASHCPSCPRLLFEDGEPLTFGEFMDAMLTLRGSNHTTVKDIVNLRKFTADEFSQLHEVLNDMCRFLAGGPAANKT